MDKYQAVFALAGRALMSGVMFYAALFNILNWSAQVALLVSLQVPLPELSLGAATALEIVLGVPLLLGFLTRWAGLLLAVYILICAFGLHPFWAAAPDRRPDEQTHFVEALAIAGGLFMAAAFGPGPISIDARRAGTTSV